MNLQDYPAVLFGPKPGQLVVIEGREFIRIDSGIYYPVELVARKVRLFEGVRVMTKHRCWNPDKPYDQPQKIGRVHHVIWYPDQREVRGILEINIPFWQRHIESVQVLGKSVGLSPMFYNIRRLLMVEDIRAVESMDLVEEPFSGGRVLPLPEAVDIMLAYEAQRLERETAPIGYFKPMEDQQPLASELLPHPPREKGRVQGQILRPRGVVRISEGI